MEVLVTGMGVVSAAGVGVAQSLRAMYAGVRNYGAPTQFETELPYPVFEVSAQGLAASGDGRTMALTHLALKQALQQAGLMGGFAEPSRVGVCLGTTVACQLNDIGFYRDFITRGEASMKPVQSYLNGDISEQVSKAYDLSGPYITVVNACSSGTDAIGIALNLIRSGICDIVIAGGSDEINLVPYCGFASLMVASTTACAPFDASRAGLNLGEGSGILIMESKVSAIKRGVNELATVAGYGTFADAYHLTAPAPDGRGLKAALLRAMQEAKVSPADVAFVNAHGTATKDNDKVEGAVLKEMLGVPFLSTKGYTGHTLGAAGGIEAVFCIAALMEGKIPASAGFIEKDEGIAMAPVTQLTPLCGNVAVSTSLAFGGNNSALVFKGKQGKQCI
jgi:3-oxoacyl-(acyl-carrier-protein) synthase